MTTMDPNEITRVIDGVYKNILENFNPSSRQMIATGKAYLKSLQGASAACSLYLDALVKLSRQAQQSSLGCAGDIGSSLMQATEVFKEIHTQQLSTLKAFYVDFLVPLETNLEKDTRVIQNEQKKFLMSHKQRIEGFSKAASSAKKVRKKSRKSNSSSALDKEIKVIQNLEDERTKLETFCENSLQEALTQERRRYGFILERKTSLAKHYLAFYSKGNTLLNHKLENWLKVAKSREVLPEAMQTSLLKRIQGEDDCIYCNPPRPADDTVSISSQLRKTKSMDASEILNVNSQQDIPLNSIGCTSTLNRAKSDINLGMMMPMVNGGGIIIEPNNIQNILPVSCNEELLQQQMQSLAIINGGPSSIALRPKSLAVSTQETSTQHGFAKALYAYLSSGENQLCFLEGDTIALIGEKNKGWQFGENLRTTKTGWFPVAYTEFDPLCELGIGMSSTTISPIPPPLLMPPTPNVPVCSTFQQKRLNLADVMVHRTPETMQQQMKLGIMNKVLKSPKTPTTNLSTSTQTPTTPTTTGLLLPNGGSRSASDSLHSSNDSGFSNDLGNVSQKPVPPQPDVDYSDDEPQLSNSEDLNSGDKWLMDRYHKSECARLGGVVDGGINSSNRDNNGTNGPKGPRRSLSFGNISASGDLDDDKNMPTSQKDLRTTTTNNRDRSQIQQRINQNAIHYDNEIMNGKDSGALQKFLTRTKSLIWKRGQNTTNNGRNERIVGGIGLGHKQSSDQNGFESFTTTNEETFQDLWGSHTSIVIAAGGSSSGGGKNNKDKKNDATQQYEMKPIIKRLDRDYIISNNDIDENTITPPISSLSTSTCTSTSKDPCSKIRPIPLPPPPPPPPNAKKRGELPLPLPPLLRRPSNKPPPSPQESSPSPNSSIENERERRHHTKISASSIHHHQHHHDKIPDTECDLSAEEFILNHRNTKIIEQQQPRKSSSSQQQQIQGGGGGQHRIVGRIESFSGSEAPIIPTQRNHHNFKNKGGGGSGGRKHGHSRARISSSNNSGFGRSISYGMGAKDLSTKHSNNRYRKESINNNNSEDNDDVDNFSDEDDLSTVNNDDNDYDDGASSVFVIETPIDPGLGLRNNTNRNNSFTRRTTTHGQHSIKSQSMRISSAHPHGNTTNNNNNKSNNNNTPRSMVTPIYGHTRINHHSSPCPSITKISSSSSTLEKNGRNIGHIKKPTRFKGSIHSEFHTVELIASDDVDGTIGSSIGKDINKQKHGGKDKPIFDYGNHIHRRLYYPERSSRMDQKSERGGNLCGPWYDLWGIDPSVSFG